MESKIIVLDPHIANQIAAGEVIERPASVIKELVENAIDAKSTKVIVEVWEGGLKELKVTDDGEGMTARDVELAFKRHATSKIKREEDLFKIKTLGFRGEALPSIAAVSQIEVLTRTRGDLEGCRIALEGGTIQVVEPAGCPPGTQIWVRNIFFNTPARKKFLKSPSKENSAVTNVVTRLALANPHVSFKLVIDGRLIFHTRGNNTLLDVVASVYNTNIAKNLLPLQKEVAGIRISGLISQCYLHRTNREMQNFFINNRYIHSLKFAKAIEAGYEGKLPNNRYPLYVVNLTIPFDQLDVNVHPTKLEVRVDKEEEVCSHLTNLVAETLAALNPVKEVAVKPKPTKDTGSFTQLNLRLPKEPVKYLEKDDKLLPGMPKQKAKNCHSTEVVMESAPEVNNKYNPEIKNVEKKAFPIITPMGQLQNSYILAEGELGLYIIDQHAAHERIYYEEFKNKYKKDFYTQMLAVPISIELTHGEVDKLVDNILLFNSLGIIIEHFGENTFIVRGLPQGFSAQDSQELVSYLISELDMNKIEKLIREDYIKLLACKKAIKAHQKLSLVEMETLIENLRKTDFPFTCPHGRPTIITFSIKSLEKKFLRN